MAQYDTILSNDEETKFKEWKQKYAPKDTGEDYDLRGAFKAGLTPDPKTGHWPDTFKKPNHPTFSNESIYAKGLKAGHWEGEKFIPPMAGDIQELPIDDLTKRLRGLFSDTTREGVTSSIPESIPGSVSAPTNSPELQNYLDVLKQAPQFSQYHPSKLRRLGSFFVGLHGGPEAQQEYKNLPFTQQYGDYARRLEGAKESYEAPQRAEQARLKNVEAIARTHAEEERAGAEKERAVAEQALARFRESQKGVLGKPIKLKPGEYLYDPGKDQFITDPEAPTPEKKLTEKEQEIEDHLAAKGIDPKKATAKDRARAEDELAERNKMVISAGEASSQEQKEYEFNQKEINDTLKPVQDRFERAGRLQDLLNANMPAIDPDVFPEVQQVFAGGAGSGVRITEASIENTKGGLNSWEKLKRAWNTHITTDPTKPFLIPPEQREQFQQVTSILMKQMRAKLDAGREAQEKLIDTTNPRTRRRVINEFKGKVADIDSTPGKPVVNMQNKAYSISKIRAAHPEKSEEQIRKDAEKAGVQLEP